MRRTYIFVPLVVLALTACGSTDVAATYAKTAPATIDANARTALTSATSLHISGEVKNGTETIALDLSLDTSGKCTGTVGLNGQQAQIISLSDNSAYMKADAAFWTSQANAQTASIVAGKWVTGFGSTSPFSTFCNLTQLSKSIVSDSVESDSAKLLGTTTVAGAPAVQLTVNTNPGTGILTVAANSPHYPLSISKGSDGTVTFSGFNVPVNATAPAGAIDLSNLSSGN